MSEDLWTEEEEEDNYMVRIPKEEIAPLAEWSLEQLLAAAHMKVQANEWYEYERSWVDDGRKEWGRYLNKWDNVKQQIIPREDGTWECHSRHAYPTGKFATAKEAMAAFEAIPLDQAYEEKDRRESIWDGEGTNWKPIYEVHRDDFKGRIIPYFWDTCIYFIYQKIDDVYEKVFESEFRFKSATAAMRHAEEVMEKLIYSNPYCGGTADNWKPQWVDKVEHGGDNE